ncbi:lysophospholipid acyltransferase 5-like [Asterias amurensis]|uniref:lysophospholipid acyltransferase 5-like n=1 Tax=Asterias amurensis TaxID=7602 RepID=UPI003AB8773D
MAQETAEMSGVFSGISGKLGIDESSLLYLLTIFSCYPLMYISRTYLHGQSPIIKHVYFIACSLTLAFCNFGFDIIYSLISVLLNYALLVTVGGSSLSVAVSFALNMGYLLSAYILVSTDGYDINWTTPHCILTLRMISVAFDLYDGKRDQANLSSEQKSLNIKTTPSLLELAGFTYFTGGFFAGPQFSIRRYLEFTEEKLLDNDKGELPNCIGPAMNRFAVGVVYAVLETILTPMFSNAYLLSEEFAASSFLYKMFAVVMWHKAVFFKYCTVFLFVEGACIMSGLAYNGKDKEGNALWDACASIKPQMLETATSTAQYIKAFNLSTNTWVGRYVFKRLKFLNNRYISQTAAVMFLAVWHGMYIGYYICFGLEIFITTCELFVQDAVKRSPPFAKFVNNPSLKLPLFIFLKFTASLSVGYPLVAFVLLRWRRIRLVYQAMFHLPTLFFLGFPFLYQFLILPRLKKQERAARKAAEVAKDSREEESKD